METRIPFALKDFPISEEEVQNNEFESVLRKAVLFYEARTRSSVDAGHKTAEMIRSYILSVFEKKRFDSIVWTEFPCILQSGNGISCLINGNKVSATIIFSPRELTVNMYKPDLTKTVFIEEHAPMVFTSQIQLDVANDYAVGIIKKLICELYYSIKENR